MPFFSHSTHTSVFRFVQWASPQPGKVALRSPPILSTRFGCSSGGRLAKGSCTQVQMGVIRFDFLSSKNCSLCNRQGSGNHCLQHDVNPSPSRMAICPLFLWATDQSPSPKAATTCRLQISEAIFHVVICHFTAIAEGAGRKIKILEPFSEIAVAAVIPYVQQFTLMNVANKILPRCTFSIIQKMSVCIK